MPEQIFKICDCSWDIWIFQKAKKTAFAIFGFKWALHLNKSEFKKSVPAIFRYKCPLNFKTSPVIFRAIVGLKNVPRRNPCFSEYLVDNFLIMIIDWMKILSYSSYIESSMSWNFHEPPMYRLENRFLRGRVPLRNRENSIRCFAM